MSDYQDSLNTIQTVVGDGSAFKNGQPQWKTVEEMDGFLTSKGFRLSSAEKMGPSGLLNGQQLIYDGPNNVIVKVKTRGYNDNGPPQRVGVATMSIEATDGKGNKWDNVLFKVDSRGKVIAKSITAINEEVVPLPADHPARKNGAQFGVKNPRDGSVRAFTKFEVIQGGGGEANPKPINKQAWADAGHMNLPKNFNPAGADDLAASIGKPPSGGGGLKGPPIKPTPPTPHTTIRGVGRWMFRSAATAAIGILLGWLKEKVDTSFINWQIEKLTPDIVGWLEARKVFIAELQAAGKKAYANVNIDIWWFHIVEYDYGVMESDTAPTVTFKSVDISDQNLNFADTMKITRENFMWEYRTPYTYSFEVSLPDDQVRAYKRIMDSLNAINGRLEDKNVKLSDDEWQRLVAERQTLNGDLKKWLDAD